MQSHGLTKNGAFNSLLMKSYRRWPHDLDSHNFLLSPTLKLEGLGFAIEKDVEQSLKQPRQSDWRIQKIDIKMNARARKCTVFSFKAGISKDFNCSSLTFSVIRVHDESRSYCTILFLLNANWLLNWKTFMILVLLFQSSFVSCTKNLHDLCIMALWKSSLWYITFTILEIVRLIWKNGYFGAYLRFWMHKRDNSRSFLNANRKQFDAHIFLSPLTQANK